MTVSPSGATEIRASHGAYDSVTGVWDIGELKPRGYYSSRGETEPTLVLSAAAATDTASVSIANTKNYEVCVGPKSNPGNLDHTMQAACEAVTNASWNSTPVYDHNTDNNMATVMAVLGAGGGGSTPASVTVMDPDASGVLVEWAAVAQVNGLGVTHYELERSASPWKMVADDVTGTMYQDKEATGSANPVYRVRAVNEAGVAGPWSQTSGMRPGAPGNFTAAVASGNTQVTLSWDAPTIVTGVTVSGYEIEVSADGGDSWTSLATAHGASPYAHTVSLSPGDSRDYRVRTVATVGGVTLNSPWATATATVAYPKPNAPTNFTATGQSATQAELEWVQPADVTNVTRTGYELGFSTDGGSMWGTADGHVNEEWNDPHHDPLQQQPGG